MNIKTVIKDLINSEYQSVFVITGGGVSAITSILSTPGASNFILEAQVPYSINALNNYLESSVTYTCNSIVANKLAAKALHRANQLYSGNRSVIGIACTAALQTDPNRKGDNRAHLSIHSENYFFYRYIEVTQDSRNEQEQFLGNIIIYYLKECIGRIR